MNIDKGKALTVIGEAIEDAVAYATMGGHGIAESYPLPAAYKVLDDVLACITTERTDAERIAWLLTEADHLVIGLDGVWRGEEQTRWALCLNNRVAEWLTPMRDDEGNGLRPVLTPVARAIIDRYMDKEQ